MEAVQEVKKVKTTDIPLPADFDLRLKANQELWGLKEIAHYFKVSIPHARDRTVHLPGFPDKVKNTKSPRWIKMEVIEFGIKK